MGDVDIGIGWVNWHIGFMGKGRLVNASDVFAVGDEVIVKALGINHRTQGWDVACLDHPKFAKKPLADYSVGQVVTGRCKGPGRKGKFAWFDVGAMVDVRVSDFGPSDSLPAEGEEMELVVTDVTRTSLSVS